MSALATILHQKGYRISGSDNTKSAITESLAGKGIKVFHSHAAGNLNSCDLVVYSSAIDKSNPERLEASNRGITLVRRAELLADLMRLYLGIAVAGTHGKTTTTAMISDIAKAGGLDPTVLVGGVLMGYNSNAITGNGEYLITEADEYDRSFLSLKPVIEIITNIELDHNDCYRDETDLRDSFRQFIENLPFYGHLVCCTDDKGVLELLKQVKKPIIGYGVDSPADYRAQDIVYSDKSVSYNLVFTGANPERVTVPLTGLHNVRNSLAAIAVADLLQIPRAVSLWAISEFKGVQRRFQIKAEVKGTVFIDDYAHHPTEVDSVLSSSRKIHPGRIICVFQPHLYSRTRDFYRQFAQALQTADLAIVTDIYPAREKPIAGVSSTLITDAASEKVRYIGKIDDVVAFLLDTIKKDDWLITMGAGDIWKLHEKIIERYQNKVL